MMASKDHTNPKPDALTHTQSKIEITSLDEIPEFDTAEAEEKFWQTHSMSEELLDEIPDALEADEV